MIIPLDGIEEWIVKSLDDPDIPDVASLGPHLSYAIQLNDGRFAGGVIYNGWAPGVASIVMSIATTTPRWATKANIRTLLQIAFDGIGARRISAIVRRNNAKSISMLKRLGFKRDCAIRGTDRLLYGMLREDAVTWIAPKDTSHTEKVTSDSPRNSPPPNGAHMKW